LDLNEKVYLSLSILVMHLNQSDFDFPIISYNLFIWMRAAQ
jgi:hypothetical protein